MIPFEMDETAYVEARKYQPLKTRLEEEGGNPCIHSGYSWVCGNPPTMTS
jgi:hypothetical protein